VEALNEAAKGSDVERIKRQSDELQNAFHALSQQLYAQQQGGPAQQGGFPGDGQNPFDGNNGGGNGRSNGGRPEDEGEGVEGEFRPS
jgi:hypothetical protein